MILYGIMFSYFAEGPFYLITFLGLSPFLYGVSFIIFALAGMLGNFTSKKAHDYNLSSYFIMQKGAALVARGAVTFLVSVILFHAIVMPALYLIMLTLISMGIMMGGIGMIIPNILSIALEDYKATLGTASSLFGFYYYCLISLFTLVMGLLHNETLFPMPIFFLVIALVMYVATNYIKKAHI